MGFVVFVDTLNLVDNPVDSNPGLGPRGPGFPARRDALVGVFAGVCETGVAPAR